MYYWEKCLFCPFLIGLFVFWGVELYKFFFFFKILFIYLFDRQRSQVGREAGRERGGSRLPAEQRAQCGA